MSPGKVLKVSIDGHYVGLFIGFDNKWQRQDLRFMYKPSFDQIRVEFFHEYQNQIIWAQIDWMKVETYDSSGDICKDSHHDWFFGRQGGGCWCLSGDLPPPIRWEGCGDYHRYYDFLNDGAATVHSHGEDGNGTELLTEMTDLDAY
eukprot:scaffold30011_cov23-Cyclotella_meneghiniana.AAC.3